ncbi:diaminobutyrate acetyltransferase [Streptomyces sp. NPDC004539]|uniref:diaminobutyrate acetyltransferase n=1 Tax=Streptomyces sp. NPDC004539 TaxID=3154280 RepID=UPI0033B6F58B
MPFPPALTIDRPTVDDGSALWRIARDSEVLDLNSPYSYLLWCRDFADTSAVARHRGEPVAFVTGYLRPDRPGTLFVWQIAVDGAHRGRGLAGTLLDALTARTAASAVETTITPDNTASRALFASYAARHRAEVEETVLFDDGLFPGAGHESEVLHRIGPLR